MVLSLAICMNNCLPHLGPCFPVCCISRWRGYLEGTPHPVCTLEEAKSCLVQNSTTIPTEYQLLMKQDDGLPPWCLQTHRPESQSSQPTFPQTTPDQDVPAPKPIHGFESSKPKSWGSGLTAKQGTEQVQGTPSSPGYVDNIRQKRLHPNPLRIIFIEAPGGWRQRGEQA